MKAFIFDPLWEEFFTPHLQAKLDAAGVIPVVTQTAAPLRACTALSAGTEPRILAVNPDYVGWKLAADDYQHIPNLRGIFGAATSTSWIDMSAAAARGIPVCNIRGFSSDAVAEWAITIMWNLARKIPLLIKDGFPLDFDKDYVRCRGVELSGKTAAIVGLGSIGSAIAARCAGLGMRVIYWSKSPKSCPYEYSALPELFRTADVVFPTMTDNPEARTIITSELLGSLRRSAMLVCVVHGLVDEARALAMVDGGLLWGYGFEAKPQSFAAYSGNVWAAPAYAWATDGSMRRSIEAWVDNMTAAAAGRFPNRVN